MGPVNGSRAVSLRLHLRPNRRNHWGWLTSVSSGTKPAPGCGSYEVRPQRGRSRFFYFEDDPGRRLRPDMLTGEEAGELATSLARGLAVTVASMTR
jgi:hypothetical protein